MTLFEFISAHWLPLMPTIAFATIMYFTGVSLQKEYDLYNWWFCLIWLSLTMSGAILVFYVHNWLHLAN